MSVRRNQCAKIATAALYLLPRRAPSPHSPPPPSLLLFSFLHPPHPSFTPPPRLRLLHFPPSSIHHSLTRPPPPPSLLSSLTAASSSLFSPPPPVCADFGWPKSGSKAAYRQTNLWSILILVSQLGWTPKFEARFAELLVKVPGFWLPSWVRRFCCKDFSRYGFSVLFCELLHNIIVVALCISKQHKYNWYDEMAQNKYMRNVWNVNFSNMCGNAVHITYESILFDYLCVVARNTTCISLEKLLSN